MQTNQKCSCNEPATREVKGNDPLRRKFGMRGTTIFVCESCYGK